MERVDRSAAEAFAGQVVGDLGAAVSALLAYLGDRLGLYKAMAAGGAMTAGELAAKTGCTERYVREWLNNQAAGGYVTYDPTADRYTLPPAQAMVLADEASPLFMMGGFESVVSLFVDEPKFAQAFQNGHGVGWEQHDPRLFHGTERFFRPSYREHLVRDWIPALEGVEAKLRAGATVADVGCGHGASTLVMAEAFPASRFAGFDYHEPSIQAARQRASEAGLDGRVRFEVGGAKDFPGNGFDLVAFFDCLHDMGDPVGAATHVRQSLKPDGTLLVVEPMAGDRVEENLHVIGRVFYGFSTVVCTPASLAQEVGLGLGAQAGEARLRAVLGEAGFTRVRRATETPFNMVLEARP